MKLLTNVCVAILTLACLGSQATAADTLASELKDAGFDGIIGTWLEEESGRKNHATAYTWKIEDRVIEVRTKDPTVASLTPWIIKPPMSSTQSIGCTVINSAIQTALAFGAFRSPVVMLSMWPPAIRA